MTRIFRIAIPLALAASAWAQDTALIGILQGELDRNFTILKQKADPPPYFISYTVTEQESYVLSATLGTLESQNHSHVRQLDVSVRVGSRQLDNYHQLNGGRPRYANSTLIPLGDVSSSIQQRVWSETDRAYHAAAQRLIQIKANQQVKVAEADNSADFSEEPPAVSVEAPPKLRVSSYEWATRLRKLSAEFGNYPGVLNSSVGVTVQRSVETLVTTEGTRLQHGRIFAHISISAQGKAADGMDLGTLDGFDASNPDRLPDDTEILTAIDRVAKDLTDLLKAPPVDPYVGPAILSGRAAGVFFHEIFGHRVEGHRQKDENEGQTFTKSVGKPVLPDFLSVIFDPTRKSAVGTDLNGYYTYDDEGVQARPVSVVEDGILKTFLMSRSPIKGFAKSNGHGRKQPGYEVVSRQSNLFVESKKTVSDKELRQQLRDEIQRQNKPYGLYFTEITGGYTTTQRRGLQAFTVIPLIVYRVYADGRPDEMVRGVSIVGTPLASFAKILATSNKPEVFNGICGAESGGVPVSAVSPAILVGEIEVQRKQKSDDRPPFLPRPGPATGGQL
ncbi:MAG TPA: metallopeptidase TldD-related protein [Bryobacteraceae bacterium]|nr:metallopeptidase TldD-related protein [Bryobacteraceae bacterium]